jgi:hypothetical protein
MTLVSYTTNGGPSIVRVGRKRLTGTAHRGPHWVSAVHVLRAATQNAVGHAGWRKSATANRVGVDIIDRIDELDARTLHVLAVVRRARSRVPSRLSQPRRRANAAPLLQGGYDAST